MGVENDLLPAKGPEAGSSTTALPDHNKHLATRRISRFVFGRLPLLGLTVLSLFSDSPPAFSQKVNNNSSSSAENTLVITHPNLESRTEPFNLTADEVFGNNVTTEVELRKTPDDILDYQLVINEQGKVKKILVLAKKDNGVDTAVTVMNLNSQGKYDKGYQTTNSLPLSPESIYESDQRFLIGGETKPGIWIPALFESKDGGKTFTAKKLPFSENSNGLIRDINQIPGTNKLLIDSWGLLSIYDPDQNTIIPVISGNRERVSIGSIPSNSQNVTLYSEIDNRLSKDVINIDTGQVLSSEIVAPGIRVDAFALIKDSAGSISGEVTNNHINKILTINIIGSRRTMEYRGWLNDLNIPNLNKDHLFFSSLYVSNGRIWAAGGYQAIDGMERAVIVSWPLNTNPNINKDALTVYRIEDNTRSIARRMEWGIFGLGLPVFLIRVENMGLVSIETKADGSPADNKAVTYLAIKDQQPPSYKVLLPVLPTAYSP